MEIYSLIEEGVKESSFEGKCSEHFYFKYVFNDNAYFYIL